MEEGRALPDMLSALTDPLNTHTSSHTLTQQVILLPPCKHFPAPLTRLCMYSASPPATLPPCSGGRPSAASGAPASAAPAPALLLPGAACSRVDRHGVAGSQAAAHQAIAKHMCRVPHGAHAVMCLATETRLISTLAVS